MRVSPAEANAHADTDSVLPVPASAVSEGVAKKKQKETKKQKRDRRRSRGERTVEDEVQDALEPLGPLRYIDTRRLIQALAPLRGHNRLGLANFGRMMKEAVDLIDDRKGPTINDLELLFTKGKRKLTEAEPLYAEAVEGFSKGLGSTHPTTLA